MSDHSMSSNDGHTTSDLHQDDGNTTESDDCRQDDPVIPDVCGAFVFNLDSAEGERRMRECLDASKIKLALWEFDRHLRNRIKYPEDTPPADDLIEELECVRRKLWRICDDHGIRLDEE